MPSGCQAQKPKKHVKQVIICRALVGAGGVPMGLECCINVVGRTQGGQDDPPFPGSGIYNVRTTTQTRGNFSTTYGQDTIGA